MTQYAKARIIVSVALILYLITLGKPDLLDSQVAYQVGIALIFLLGGVALDALRSSIPSAYALGETAAAVFLLAYGAFAYLPTEDAHQTSDMYVFLAYMVGSFLVFTNGVANLRESLKKDPFVLTLKRKPKQKFPWEFKTSERNV